MQMRAQLEEYEQMIQEFNEKMVSNETLCAAEAEAAQKAAELEEMEREKAVAEECLREMMEVLLVHRTPTMAVLWS